MDQKKKTPMLFDVGGLTDLPPCPVTTCDACGKSIHDGPSWIQKGYGCSLCKGTDPHVWIRDNARLRDGIAAYIEAEQLDRDDIRDLSALLATKPEDA